MDWDSLLTTLARQVTGGMKTPTSPKDGEDEDGEAVYDCKKDERCDARLLRLFPLSLVRSLSLSPSIDYWFLTSFRPRRGDKYGVSERADFPPRFYDHLGVKETMCKMGAIRCIDGSKRRVTEKCRCHL